MGFRKLNIKKGSTKTGTNIKNYFGLPKESIKRPGKE